MKLFDYLDDALLKAETSRPRVSREAFIWPSSASAPLNGGESQYVGKCQRAEIWKMTGEPQTNPTDAVSARRFRMGRACEADITKLAQDSGIFVASGVRAFIPDINMTLELDLVTIDPKDSRGYICEVKSIYGYFGNKEVVKDGKPKKEAVMQLLVYLNEFRTGAILKEAIKKCLEKQQALKDKVASLERLLEADPGNDQLQGELRRARYELGRNRIEVDHANLEKLDDGPLGGKLVYQSRDECATREFDLAIWEDPASRKHYPQIDNEPYRWFDLEAIYARWRDLQGYYNRMRDEAIRILKTRGLEQPGEGATAKELDAFWAEVGSVMRALPASFLPPAEYEWSWPASKIEEFFRQGFISKTRYQNWSKQKPGFERLGAWQCLDGDTLIEMEDGTFKPIKDVQEGDVTSQGKVTAAANKPVDKEVVKVQPYGLMPIVLTADHRVKTSDGWKAAAELTPMVDCEIKLENYTGVSRERAKELRKFDEVMVPFDTTQVAVPLSDLELEIVGLWLAEGHYHMMTKNGDHYLKCGFTIHPNEDAAADLIKEWAFAYTNQFGSPATVTDRVKTDPRNGNHFRVLTVNSVAATQFLMEWAGGPGARFKGINRILMQATLDQQAALLSGLMRGDGCNSNNRTSPLHDYTSASYQLASDVQRILWRMGKVAGIRRAVKTKHAPGFEGAGPAYKVRWYEGTSYASRIANGVFYSKIFKVTRNVPYGKNVYDLEIAGTEQIPTISGIVHNCSFCGWKGKCVPMEYPNMAYLALGQMLDGEEAA